MPKNTFPSYGVNWHNYGVNPRTLFYMGFECFEIKLLKGLGLRFGMKTFLLSHVSWASLATEVLAHKHLNHSEFKGIQHIDWKIMVHSQSDGIFVEPRRLFFMTAFSRGDGQHFSHNWKRHLFQPQGGSRYLGEYITFF